MFRIREVCKNLPKGRVQFEASDSNVADQIFASSSPQQFQMSNTVPAARYQRRVQTEDVRAALENAPAELAHFGPNELYLWYRWLNARPNFYCLVGGIGVGKTSACRLLREQLRTNKSIGSDAAESPAFQVYVDVRTEGTDLSASDIARLLSDNIKAAIYRERPFSRDEEVTDVWKGIFDYTVHHDLGDSVVAELQGSLARSRSLDMTATIEARHATLETRSQNRLWESLYLAHVLQWIRSNRYPKHRLGVVVVVDNIDRIKNGRSDAIDHVRRMAKLAPDVRFIVPVRQTTYWQDVQYNDRLHGLPADDPYCGADVSGVLDGLLGQWLDEGPTIEGAGAADASDLVAGIANLRTELFVPKGDRQLPSPALRFLTAATGRSVRRGMFLGKRLILNSVYSPRAFAPRILDEERAAGYARSLTGDIIRAIVVGSDSEFMASEQQFFDNVFDFAHKDKVYPLLKLHILTYLSKARPDDGRPVNALWLLLKSMRYPMGACVAAVNRLKAVNKRLIWSDEYPDDLTRLGTEDDSKLFLTSIGRGYLDVVCQTLEYVETVMPDTRVHPGREVLSQALSRNDPYDASDTEDWFILVLRFLDYLIKEEGARREKARKALGEGQYFASIGTPNLVVKGIVDAITNSMLRILRAKNLQRENLAEWEKDFESLRNLCQPRE